MIERSFKIGVNAGFSVAPVIHVNQYDHDEVWYFTLIQEDGQVYKPSTGSIVGIKADGNVIINSGTVNSSGQIVINETQQMTAAVGNAVYELVFDAGTHGTANFIVRVEPKPGDNATISDSDISLIEEAIVMGSRIVAYGSPLVATTASQMTSKQNVYVYTGSESGYTNGHWYYWNGSAWTDGGVYNAVAVNTDKTLSVENMAADGKATGDAIADLKNALNELYIINEDNIITPNNIRDSTTSSTVDKVNKTITVNYDLTANTETFLITLRDSAHHLSLDALKKYFFYCRVQFGESQTSAQYGRMQAQISVDGGSSQYIDTNDVRLNNVAGVTRILYGTLEPTVTGGYLRFVFNGMGTSPIHYDYFVDKLVFIEYTDDVTAEKLKSICDEYSNPVDKVLYSTADKNADDIELLKNNYDTDLLCWGDSLTAGAGGNGTTYPAVCASELGCTVMNCGVGGENCQTIAARQGGNNVVIPAGNVNGTYTTLTDIFGNTIEPLLQGSGSGSGSSVIVDGIECSLSYAQGTGYTISGYTGAAKTIPTIARFKGSDFTGKIACLWIGTNGGSFPGLNAGIDVRIAWLRSMIEHINHNNYVVLGIIAGVETADFYINEENLMKQAFGNKYFPTRKMLIDNGLTITGLTPTAQDTQDISDGKVPTSLKSDTAHLNAYGYTALGKMLSDKIRSLGYVE